MRSLRSPKEAWLSQSADLKTLNHPIFSPLAVTSPQPPRGWAVLSVREKVVVSSRGKADQGSRIKRKTYEVRGEDLVEIVKSDEFRSRLAEAARTCVRTGCETGFAVYREVQPQRDHWTPVFQGDEYTIPAGTFVDWQMKRGLLHTVSDTLIKVHFHPHCYEDDHGISLQDLLGIFSGEFGLETRPIAAVAIVDEALSDGYMFLMQRDFDGGFDENPNPHAMRLDNEQRHYFYWHYIDGFRDTWKDEDCADFSIPGCGKGKRMHFSVPRSSQLAHIHDPEVAAHFAYQFKVAEGHAE